MWDFGYWYAGGSSPCCIGQWKTKEETIKKAIERFDIIFSKFTGHNMYKEDYFNQARKAFFYFKHKTLLCDASQTEHIKHIPDNGKNYKQLTFFKIYRFILFIVCVF